LLQVEAKKTLPSPRRDVAVISVEVEDVDPDPTIPTPTQVNFTSTTPPTPTPTPISKIPKGHPEQQKIVFVPFEATTTPRRVEERGKWLATQKIGGSMCEPIHHSPPRDDHKNSMRFFGLGRKVWRCTFERSSKKMVATLSPSW